MFDGHVPDSGFSVHDHWSYRDGSDIQDAPPKPTDSWAVVPRFQAHLWLYSWFRSVTFLWFPKTFACGHKGPRRFALNCYGEILNLTNAYLKKNPRCGECLLKETLAASIRCARCGFLIDIGDPIAHYDDREKYNPQWKTKTASGKVIGCMRHNCCPSATLVVGKWEGK